MEMRPTRIDKSVWTSRNRKKSYREKVQAMQSRYLLAVAALPTTVPQGPEVPVRTNSLAAVAEFAA